MTKQQEQKRSRPRYPRHSPVYKKLAYEIDKAIAIANGPILSIKVRASFEGREEEALTPHEIDTVKALLKVIDDLQKVKRNIPKWV